MTAKKLRSVLFSFFLFSFLSGERRDKGGGPFPQVYPVMSLPLQRECSMSYPSQEVV